MIEINKLKERNVRKQESESVERKKKETKKKIIRKSLAEAYIDSFGLEKRCAFFGDEKRDRLIVLLLVLLLLLLPFSIDKLDSLDVRLLEGEGGVNTEGKWDDDKEVDEGGVVLRHVEGVEGGELLIFESDCINKLEKAIERWRRGEFLTEPGLPKGRWVILKKKKKWKRLWKRFIRNKKKPTIKKKIKGNWIF